MDWIGQLAALLTALAALAGGVFALYKHFALKERERTIRAAFEQAIDMVSADDEAHRRAAAIILRRFFDEDAEQGGRGRPYAREALNVIAALLRGAETDAVQKLLADGLAYAPTLENADLQRTNLQQAYLGTRPGRRVEMSRADFFRADLTGASLRGASARSTVFYQARLVNTVFKEADLTGANFFEADLLGAQFDRAILDGASFNSTQNVPVDILTELDCEGVYRGNSRDTSSISSPRPIVFFSRPGAADIASRGHLRALADRVRDRGFDIVEIGRNDYATSGAVAEVRRVMSRCAGVVVGSVVDLEIQEGRWRIGTPDARVVTELSLPSTWTFLELGVAFGLGLPILLASGQAVDPDAFDYGKAEPELRQVLLEQDHRSRAFLDPFDEWCGLVRETSRRAARSQHNP
jgi:uncharacterized protein YjbI with pentapeptide repeats